ncbi:MAG: CPBP family intramembrane metalloprotease [Bacteroidales bacterium]|nr:CPBP family intramembrane metalloprotease [Bacteroidales bacterium]MCF8454664.1 CPBP family intramembrane metalloprotease [Bacteroidales bacterium]
MFKNLSPFSQLVIAGLVVVATALVVMIVGAVIAIPVFGFNYFANPAQLALAVSENVAVAKYFQILNSLGMFVIPPFIIAKMFDGNAGNYLAINKTPRLTTVILTGLAMVAALPIIGYTAEINAKISLPGGLHAIEEWMRNMEEAALDMTVKLLRMDTFSDFLINMLMIALIPALGEELLFRGVIQRILGEWARNHLIAILITAFLFSAFHMQFMSFLPRFLLGIYLGYLLVWTKNIWLPIIAHFVNNAGAVIYYYVSDVDISEDMANPASDDFPFYVVLISVVVFFVIARLIARKERELV